MLKKIYLEITDVCNFSCSFCHKTSRAKRFMTEEEFDTLTDKLRGKAKYLYFHLMGEPTLHPLLPKFISIAKEKGFLPILTTNGSLLAERGDEIIKSGLYKVNISLHAPSANPKFSDPDYLSSCIGFSKKASGNGIITVLRLWNLGTDDDNTEIINGLRAAFEQPWTPTRVKIGYKLADKLFLEQSDRFKWPDISLPECAIDADRFCYGLRDQVGVLCDGTVVPCCLDADGQLALGDLFENELDDILVSPKAKAIYDGFSCRRAVEALCRKCGYAERFSTAF